MSFIEGISGERFHYLLKMIFKSHSNRQNDKQYKFIYTRFQMFITLCYTMAGGHWGPQLQYQLGPKCRQLPNLHEGHEGEPSPLIEEFIFPDLSEQNDRIFPTRICDLKSDFDDEIVRQDPILRQQFINRYGNASILDSCRINKVMSFYLNDRYKSSPFSCDDEWNWVQVVVNDSNNEGNNENEEKNQSVLRRYGRVKNMYQFVFQDPNDDSLTVKKVFWEGFVIKRDSTIHATDEQFNDYSSKSFDCLDKVNSHQNFREKVWLPLESIDSAVLLLHECYYDIFNAKVGKNIVEATRNLINKALNDNWDASKIPCGVKFIFVLVDIVCLIVLMCCLIYE